MATKSMLKNVDIKEKYLGKQLVEALETAVKHKRKEKSTEIICDEVKKDELAELFG